MELLQRERARIRQGGRAKPPGCYRLCWTGRGQTVRTLKQDPRYAQNTTMARRTQVSLQFYQPAIIAIADERSGTIGLEISQSKLGHALQPPWYVPISNSWLGSSIPFHGVMP